MMIWPSDVLSLCESHHYTIQAVWCYNDTVHTSKCTSLDQHYMCDTVNQNVVQQITWIVTTRLHASWWSSGDKAKWYGKEYYTNTTCLCFKNFHSNCVLPTKQLFLKDVQHCLATTRRTTSVSHVSKNQLHILLRPITLYPFWSLFKTWLTMKI